MTILFSKYVPTTTKFCIEFEINLACMVPTWHFDDGAVVEVLAEQGGVDGGRHDDDPEVRVGVDHVPEDDHDEVGVDVALVGLVDNDVGDAAESGLQLPQQNPHRAEHDGAVGTGERRLEADAVTSRNSQLFTPGEKSRH